MSPPTGAFSASPQGLRPHATFGSGLIAKLLDCQIARLPACQSRRLIFEEQRPHRRAHVIRVDEMSWRAQTHQP